MGTIADTAIAVVDHLREPGPPGRLRRGHELPAVPDRRSWRGPPARPRGRRRRADRRAARRGEPADPRDPVGALRRGGRGRDGPARPVVLGRARLARRRRRRPRRGLRSTSPSHGERVRAGTPSSASATRSRSSACRSTSGRPARGRCAAIRSAGSARSRPTSWWRRSRASCSTSYVQAYPRYGSEKKGLPTTYYLTIADAPIRAPRRARSGRLRAAPRRLARSASATRSPGSSTAATLFIQSPLADPEAIWRSIPARARAEIVARRIRVTALDTVGARRAPRAPARTS